MKYVANHLLKLLLEKASFEKMSRAQNTVCQLTHSPFNECAFLFPSQLQIILNIKHS